MRFRLTWYDTQSDCKYDAEGEHRHEYLGSSRAIWSLWFLLVKKFGHKHVEVFSIDGTKQEPEKGHVGMIGYGL